MVPFKRYHGIFCAIIKHKDAPFEIIPRVIDVPATLLTVVMSKRERGHSPKQEHGQSKTAQREQVTYLTRPPAVSYTHLTLPTNREV